MNRRYTKEGYLGTGAEDQSRCAGYFPDNRHYRRFSRERRREDFQETLDVVRQVRYDSAFTFIYSRRTGTPAAVMKDQVPEDVVKDRFNRLLEEVQRISAEMCARYEGTVQRVLVESVNEHDESLMTGRMSGNLLVHFPGDASLIGKFVDVSLDECRGFYISGK